MNRLVESRSNGRAVPAHRRAAPPGVVGGIPGERVPAGATSAGVHLRLPRTQGGIGTILADHVVQDRTLVAPIVVLGFGEVRGHRRRGQVRDHQQALGAEGASEGEHGRRADVQSRLFTKGRDPNRFKGSSPLCSSSVTTIRTPGGHTLTTTPSSRSRHVDHVFRFSCNRAYM